VHYSRTIYLEDCLKRDSLFNFFLKKMVQGFGSATISLQQLSLFMANNHEGASNGRTLWSRVLHVIQPERKEISAIYFFAVLYGIIQLSLPLGIQSIVNFVMAQTFSTSLWILIGLVVLGVLISGVLQVNQMKINEKIQQQLFVRYSFHFANHIPKIDIKGIDGYHLPELVNRFFDVVSLQKGLSKLLLDIPIASIQIVFGLVLLSAYSSIFIAFGFALILLLYLILRFTASSGLASSMLESDYKYKVAGWLEEVARILPTFKFNIPHHLHLKRVDENLDGYLSAKTKHFKILLIQYWSLIIFKILITSAMLIVGVVLLVNRQLNIGQFVAAEIVILVVLTSVEKFIVSLDNVYDVLTSIEKLNKVLEKPVEKEGSLDIADKPNGYELGLNDVSIGFLAKDNVLKNISFTLPASKTMCVMGESGSGKSLVLKLFTGIYNDYEGQILVDRLPIHNYRLDSLHSVIGIKLNSRDIFTGTVYENITMGNGDIQPHDISDLAGKLGFEALLQQFGLGLDEPLEIGGKKLPQLAKNQVLLLRALIDHPSIVLLETPFEGMDESMQQKVANYLLNMPSKPTLIVVSNKKEFAAQCDYCMQLENGQMLAFGPSKEVLSRN
jgi:ATP-binding cassette, subfamily B, bacterial